MTDDTATYRKLYRSRTDRVVGGVAGGLGHYFGLDPVLIRIGLVALTLGAGVGLFAYIVALIVIPERPMGDAEPLPPTPIERERGRQVAGYVLLGIGLLVLAKTTGVSAWLHFDWDLIWPVALIGLGGYLLLRRRPASARQSAPRDPQEG